MKGCETWGRRNSRASGMRTQSSIPPCTGAAASTRNPSAQGESSGGCRWGETQLPIPLPESETVESLGRAHVPEAHCAEKLRGKRGTILIDHHAHAVVSPWCGADRRVVFGGAFPQGHQPLCGGGLSGGGRSAGDDLGQVLDPQFMRGGGHPGIGSHVAHIRSIQAEASAVFAKVFAVLAGQSIQHAVALQGAEPLTRAVLIRQVMDFRLNGRCRRAGCPCACRR